MRTIETAAADLRAEFGKDIFLVAIEATPDPKDGKKTQLKYQWWRTCDVGHVQDVLNSLIPELK